MSNRDYYGYDPEPPSPYSGGGGRKEGASERHRASDKPSDLYRESEHDRRGSTRDTRDRRGGDDGRRRERRDRDRDEEDSDYERRERDRRRRDNRDRDDEDRNRRRDDDRRRASNREPVPTSRDSPRDGGDRRRELDRRGSNWDPNPSPRDSPREGGDRRRELDRRGSNMRDSPRESDRKKRDPLPWESPREGSDLPPTTDGAGRKHNFAETAKGLLGKVEEHLDLKLLLTGVAIAGAREYSKVSKKGGGMNPAALGQVAVKAIATGAPAALKKKGGRR